LENQTKAGTTTREQSTAANGERGLQPRRTAILVLGMHRSGTSAIGGIVAAYGAATPKNLLPESFSNPKGHWESTPLTIVDDDLIVAAASSWHDWLPLDRRWLQSPAAERFRHTIKAIILSEFGDAPLFFIKDPRICRFVPFMTSILADLRVDPVALLPVRNPLEVAYSLQLRDQLALPTSLMLWLRHVLDAEYHSRQMPRYILPHDELLAGWRHHMDRAARQMGIVWPASADQAAAATAEFLTEELHRQRASVADLQNHPAVTPMVRDAYDILRAMAADGDSQNLRDQLDRVRAKFDESCDAVSGAVIAGHQTTQQLRGALGTCMAERDALAHAQQELVQARDGVLAERDALSQSRQELIRSRDSVVAERDALARTCDSLAAERDAVFASRSWRLTAPLRWVVTFIRRR
jgi:hypothetical protein